MSRAARMADATTKPLFDRRALGRVRSLATTIDDRAIAFTNLDRVLWPAAGFTKADLAHYYLAIADALLPYLADRALTVGRFPSGVDGRGFAQIEVPGRPPWIRAARIALAGSGEVKEFTIVEERAALAWLVQMGTIELHTFLGHASDLATPTAVLFDLDPTAPATFADAARVACMLHEKLRAIGLEAYAKTSGSVGIHVVVPLNTPARYAETRAFAEIVARAMAAERPELVTATLRRAGREGKVLVDTRQNAERLTMVVPWSLRAADLPTVSTPVTWRELESLGQRELVFTAAEALKRAADADPFAPVLAVRQRLP
ncbi:MAG TPA: non-homologous end-joining DNA ligase [Labilithrix sp.]|jgi:bifunctional non-homologous end joining protein LigD